MKRLMTTITALTLASVMALMNPVKILASNTTGAVYLSEIRVGMGKSSSEAANALEGYSIDDYDTLMDDYLREQIIPFVDGFIAAIEEYRENYHSSFPANKARAEYVHERLNEMTDDDCGGAGLAAGALVSGLLVNASEKKKRKKEETA